MKKLIEGSQQAQSNQQLQQEMSMKKYNNLLSELFNQNKVDLNTLVYNYSIEMNK